MQTWALHTWPACGVVEPLLVSFGCPAERVKRAVTVQDQYCLLRAQIHGLDEALFASFVEVYITLSEKYQEEV